MFFGSNGSPAQPFLPNDLWREFLGLNVPLDVRLNDQYGNHTLQNILGRKGEDLQGPSAISWGRMDRSSTSCLKRTSSFTGQASGTSFSIQRSMAMEQHAQGLASSVMRSSNRRYLRLKRGASPGRKDC